LVRRISRRYARFRSDMEDRRGGRKQGARGSGGGAAGQCLSAIEKHGVSGFTLLVAIGNILSLFFVTQISTCTCEIWNVDA
jgi:hypothetical protein